jgi:hypothetical protein
VSYGHHVDYSYNSSSLGSIAFTEEISFDNYETIKVNNTSDRILRITYRKTDRMVQDSSTVYIADLQPGEFIIVTKSDYSVIKSLCVSTYWEQSYILDNAAASYELTCDDYTYTRDLTVAEVTVNVGDVNLDGKINVSDLLALRKYTLQEEDGYNTDVMDIDRNGKVNVSDLLALRRYVLGDESISNDTVTLVTIKNTNKTVAA